MRFAWTLGLVALLAGGCDEDDGVDAGPPPADAGGLDAGETDAGGTDAGGADAGADAGRPGAVIAEGVCVHAGAVAVAPDGSAVAWVACEGEAGVFAAPLDGAAVRLGDATASTELRWSPDPAWVLVDRDGLSTLRRADGAGSPVALGGVVTDDLRFIEVGDDEVRVVYLTTDGGTRRVTMRSSLDGFASPATLIDDATIVGTLRLISGSRNTLVVEVESGGVRGYELAPTDASAAPQALPIDPLALLMGPVGMGDTHALARRAGGGFAFVAFETGDEAVLETEGLTPGVEWIVAESGGVRFAYYLRDGDPIRRPRDGSGSSVVLDDADASDLWITPNGQRLVYPSGGRAWSVRVGGGAPTDLGAYGAARFEGALAPSSIQLALVESGALTVMPTDAPGAATAVDTGVIAQSVTYDGVGGRLLYRAAVDPMGRTDVLRAADLRDPTPVTLASGVSGAWPVPGREDVLYRAGDATLNRL